MVCSVEIQLTLPANVENTPRAVRSELYLQAESAIAVMEREKYSIMGSPEIKLGSGWDGNACIEGTLRIVYVF
jgi:hypothetical protein